MTLFSRLFRKVELPPTLERVRAPRVAVFGDSHTAALQSAKEFPKRNHVYEHVRIYRVLKNKNGRAVGDTTLAEFCQAIRGYSESDFVFSAVGGNQYAVVSTVRSPVEYDFLTSPEDEDFAGNGTTSSRSGLSQAISRRGSAAPWDPCFAQIRAVDQRPRLPPRAAASKGGQSVHHHPLRNSLRQSGARRLWSHKAGAQAEVMEGAAKLPCQAL